MRSSQFLLCILFMMISIMENKYVHRKTTKENLAEVRMRIEDIKEKLKTSATSNNRNTTQISEYKELLIKLIEEMNDIQHEISQKRKEDNQPHKLSSLMRTNNIPQDLLNKSIDEYPTNETVSDIFVKTYENRIDRWDSFHHKRKENLHDTVEKKPEYVNQSHKADTVQDLLNESVEGEILNETNVNETKKTRDNNIESREQIDTSSLFSYPKTSEYLHRRPERRPVLVRVRQTSTQSSYEEPVGFLEEEKSHSDKKQINAAETDVRTTKSKKTNHYFISKLKNRLQFLENSFHDFFIHENTEHNCSKHDIKHTSPKTSESDPEENDKTWYEQEKDNGSSDYSYHNHYMHTNRKPTRNKCLTFNSNDLRSLKRNHVGINEVNHQNLENFSDIKEFDEKYEKDNSEYGRRAGDKHKYKENKVDMPVYKTKCNVDSFNESYQFHQEKDFHKKSEIFKGVSHVNNEHDISNEALLNPDKSNSENHLKDETSDLNFLLEEVDDTNYGDDSTITESKGERTNQSIEKESNVKGSSTLYLKKNLFYRRKSSNHSREKTVRANISKFTKMRQSVAPEITNDKAQSSTRVVCTIFAKPLLRNIENEVFEKTPQNPAIAVGLALMCLLTFLTILAAVQFTTNFLVNDPRAKNIFLFHGK